MGATLWSRLVTAPTLVFLSACATVSCPDVADAADPRAVFLLDHGRHASLVVQVGERRLNRYSYGDRRWYAEGDTGVGQAFAALFRKTPAVLLRQELHAAPRSGAVERALRVGVQHTYPLRAPGARVDALVTELDAIWNDGAGDPGADYSPHPRPYVVGHNSNHMVAEWLGDLGCETRGAPMMSRWRVH